MARKKKTEINGKKIVITGKLLGMTRDEAAAEMEALGAQVVGSVSKNTDYVVLGERPGSKLARAQALQIPLLTEEQLCDIVGRVHIPAPAVTAPPPVVARAVGLQPEFTGKAWVVTGTLSAMKRDEVTAELQARGAKVSGSVSKNTHCLVVGALPGSKLARARELGVPVITEEELGAMLAAKPAAGPVRVATKPLPRVSVPAGTPSTEVAGKSYVITGTLSSMKRDEARAHLLARGAHITDSVSKNTDYLVTGASPGSKLGRAQKLGIPILSEDELRQRLGLD